MASTLKECTVSVIGGDGQTHVVEVRASSLFDAAAQAMQWARLTWYQRDAIIDVRAGDRTWKVQVERVRRCRSHFIAATVFLPLTFTVRISLRTRPISVSGFRMISSSVKNTSLYVPNAVTAFA